MYKQLRKEKGFTIIEVMIVLAIAGLILLIVFLAVPALQRTARNTTIKNDASAVAGGITEFESNNNGTPPTGVNANGTSAAGPTAQGPAIYLATTANSIQAQAKVNGATTVNVVTKVPVSISTSTVDLYIGQTCAGDASTRAIAVYYGIDTSAGPTVTPGCIDS
jgi:prepilin-type N-terminal cleavage/methylation domain-containing protein